MEMLAGVLIVGIGAIVVLFGATDFIMLARTSAAVARQVRSNPDTWVGLFSRGDNISPAVGQVLVTRASGQPTARNMTVSLMCIVVAFDADHFGIVYPDLLREVWSVFDQNEVAAHPIHVETDARGSVRLVGGPLRSRIYLGHTPNEGFTEALIEYGWATRG